MTAISVAHSRNRRQGLLSQCRTFPSRECLVCGHERMSAMGPSHVCAECRGRALAEVMCGPGAYDRIMRETGWVVA